MTAQNNEQALESIYQLLRSKGCAGTANYPNYKSFMNRNRKLEQVRDPALSEKTIAAINTAGKITRPMFGYQE